MNSKKRLLIISLCILMFASGSLVLNEKNIVLAEIIFPAIILNFVMFKYIFKTRKYFIPLFFLIGCWVLPNLCNQFINTDFMIYLENEFDNVFITLIEFTLNVCFAISLVWYSIESLSKKGYDKAGISSKG